MHSSSPTASLIRSILIVALLSLVAASTRTVVAREPLDAVTDTLQLDDNSPAHIFRFPDAYGDDLRNMRFAAPASGQIVGAQFGFVTDDLEKWTSGTPDLIAMAWQSGTDSLPLLDSELARDTVLFSEFRELLFDVDSTWRTAARLVSMGFTEPVTVDSGTLFHIGYSAVLHTSADSLSILADDGVPASSAGSEFYSGRFEFLSASWAPANLMIRALFDDGSLSVRPITPGVRSTNTLNASAYPNPFNASTTIEFTRPSSELGSVVFYDVLGRVVDRVFVPARGGSDRATIIWGRSQATGTYFAKIGIGRESTTIRLNVVR